MFLLISQHVNITLCEQFWKIIPQRMYLPQNLQNRFSAFPTLLFKTTQRFTISVFAIGCECFSACGVYPYTRVCKGTKNLALEDYILISRCKFVAKMVLSSNIYLVIGINFQHEEEFCGIFMGQHKKVIRHKLFPCYSVQ